MKLNAKNRNLILNTELKVLTNFIRYAFYKEFDKDNSVNFECSINDSKLISSLNERDIKDSIFEIARTYNFTDKKRNFKSFICNIPEQDGIIKYLNNTLGLASSSEHIRDIIINLVKQVTKTYFIKDSTGKRYVYNANDDIQIIINKHMKSITGKTFTNASTLKGFFLHIIDDYFEEHLPQFDIKSKLYYEYLNKVLEDYTEDLNRNIKFVGLTNEELDTMLSSNYLNKCGMLRKIIAETVLMKKYSSVKIKLNKSFGVDNLIDHFKTVYKTVASYHVCSSPYSDDNSESDIRNFTFEIDLMTYDIENTNITRQDKCVLTKNILRWTNYMLEVAQYRDNMEVVTFNRNGLVLLTASDLEDVKESNMRISHINKLLDKCEGRDRDILERIKDIVVRDREPLRFNISYECFAVFISNFRMDKTSSLYKIYKEIYDVCGGYDINESSDIELLNKNILLKSKIKGKEHFLNEHNVNNIIYEDPEHKEDEDVNYEVPGFEDTSDCNLEISTGDIDSKCTETLEEYNERVTAKISSILTKDYLHYILSFDMMNIYINPTRDIISYCEKTITDRLHSENIYNFKVTVGVVKLDSEYPDLLVIVHSEEGTYYENIVSLSKTMNDVIDFIKDDKFNEETVIILKKNSKINVTKIICILFALKFKQNYELNDFISDGSDKLYLLLNDINLFKYRFDSGILKRLAENISSQYDTDISDILLSIVMDKTDYEFLLNISFNICGLSYEFYINLSQYLNVKYDKCQFIESLFDNFKILICDSRCSIFNNVIECLKEKKNELDSVYIYNTLTEKNMEHIIENFEEMMKLYSSKEPFSVVSSCNSSCNRGNYNLLLDNVSITEKGKIVDVTFKSTIKVPDSINNDVNLEEMTNKLNELNNTEDYIAVHKSSLIFEDSRLISKFNLKTVQTSDLKNHEFLEITSTIKLEFTNEAYDKFTKPEKRSFLYRVAQTLKNIFK